MLGSGLSGRFTVRKGTRRHAIVNSTLNRPVKWRGGRVAIATRERSDAPRNLNHRGNRYYTAMRPTDVVRVGVSHRSETPADVRGREAVIDRRRLRPRCFHLRGYFRHTSFSLSLLLLVVPSVRCLQRVVLRGKAKAVYV